MKSQSLFYYAPPIITISNGKQFAAAPVSKIVKRYTLKHFILFYLADFIVLGLFVIAFEWFFK